MSYMRASFLMRKTRYVKTYVKWTELFGNREKATILNRGKSPYTKGVIVVDIVDKALRMGEGRQIKKLENVAKATNALEDKIAALDDEELKGQTAKFKQRIENGESLDKLMPEAFATVREASKRTLGLRHFDVQLMGGAALHWGNIAEMKTGEGKTLVATLPAYLNALDGQGVHVVTVNDYLASYQSELMGRIYRFLGMNVGCIITEQKPPERRKQYNADITYGTNNEFGFDYLRDNMAWEKADLVQRGHHYAIVDEVDSFLSMRLSTPLIISVRSEGDVTRWYRQFARLVLKLNRDEDYDVDEKKKVVGILDPGITKVEDYLGIDNLYEPNNTALIGYLNNQRHQGQGAVPARPRLRRDRRRGAHRRRAHRPYPSGPPLQRGSAPSHRSQGRRGGQGREPDLRHHHPAELLPYVRQARGHDRYRRDRSRRIHGHLQAGRAADSDQQADDPRG